MVVPIHGVNTRVYFNTIDISGYLTDASLEGTVDTAETTTFGVAGNAKTYIPGLRDRTFTSSGRYDVISQAALEASLTAGTGILTFCPGGASAIGDLSWMATVIDTTLTESSNIADVVAFDWDAQTTGGVAAGYVLHPLAIDTGTTTGATRDDGAGNAPSATGWTAQLHVTAVSSGSWVIKLVDGAASNMSDAADLTGGAFTAVTGATQQRLVSAAATTSVKRYVRVVATATGGSSPTITYVLSFARSMQL